MTTTNANRLFRIYDGTAWGPVAPDLSPTTAVEIATVDTSTLRSGLEVDALPTPNTLYVRDATGSIHAVAALPRRAPSTSG